MQRHATSNVLNKKIKKLLVSRKFYDSSFENQFFYLLVGEQSILFGNSYTTEPQDLFQYVLLD